MVQVPSPVYEYDVYLIQAEEDESWVEVRLAKRLEDNEGLRPHFFKWRSIPGTDVEETMLDGLDKSGCCAVCLGKEMLGGSEEMLRKAATRRNADNTEYRLIPVLLPGSNPDSIPEPLHGLSKIDFRDEGAFDYEFYRLVCGIQNKPPGPWPPPGIQGEAHKTTNLSPVNKEKYEEAFVALLDIVSAGEKTGLPKEEATEFRRKAFEKIQKQITEAYLKQVTQDFSVDQVTVRQSRTTDGT
jgi:hypothetical protein